MKRSRKKRIRQMELQEVKRQEWWEEQKDDEFPYDDGFGVQIARPLVFFLKILENERENLSPEAQITLSLLTKPDDLSFI